jgi:hypothetical protein
MPQSRGGCFRRAAVEGVAVSAGAAIEGAAVSEHATVEGWLFSERAGVEGGCWERAGVDRWRCRNVLAWKGGRFETG